MKTINQLVAERARAERKARILNDDALRMELRCAVAFGARPVWLTALLDEARRRDLLSE